MNYTFEFLAMSTLWIPVVAIIFGCSIPIVAIIYGTKYAKKEQELWHETARIALENGQPVPPNPSGKKNKPKRNDIRVGLILIAVGIGLSFTFDAIGISRISTAGGIPGLIGVALLGYGIFERITEKNKSDSDEG